MLALEVLPVYTSRVITQIQADIEPVPLEAALPHEHEDRREPLLSVDHVVDQLPAVVALIEENARERIPFDDRVNQPLPVAPGPQTLCAGIRDSRLIWPWRNDKRS